MATSDGFLRRALAYLESTRNLVGCGAGAVGLGLHFAGLGGVWWPGVVAGLYGAGALLTPGARRVVVPPVPPVPKVPPMPTGSAPRPRPAPAEPAEGSGAVSASGAGSAPAPVSAPVPDPELVALAAYLDTVALPASAGVDRLLEALRLAGPGPVADGIVRFRLPVAVAGYLRALAWRPWAGADGPDPEAELGREVRRLSAELG
ncbi:hypothetical protein ACIRS1_31405 [Kitasatospora sp. NPDC101176]|uniref:hypothetical protein n=1 Tax=Kitasatospora sp. NPDC101176 TaxID=3364099 RepID=UPI0037F8B6E0